MLSSIFEFFSSTLGLYSDQLFQFLEGYDCNVADYAGSNEHLTLFGISLGVAFAGCVIFYYEWNPIRLQIITWLGVLATFSVIAGGLAYGFVLSPPYEEGLIGECLQYANGVDAPPTIEGGDLFGAALSCALLSFVSALLLSCGMKFFSSNNKYTPF